MLTKLECIKSIYFESCHHDGFFQKFSRNEIDLESFHRLLSAISEYEKLTQKDSNINKLVCACLIDMPAMIRNASDHFRDLNTYPDVDIRRMSVDLLDAVSRMMGGGLDKHFLDYVEVDNLS